jgi:hypothetical protein
LGETEGLALSGAKAGDAHAPVRDSADLPAIAEEGGHCQNLYPPSDEALFRVPDYAE